MKKKVLLSLWSRDHLEKLDRLTPQDSTCFQVVFRSCWMDKERNVNCCTWSNSTDNLGSGVLSIPRKWKYMFTEKYASKKYCIESRSSFAIKFSIPFPFFHKIIFIGYSYKELVLFMSPCSRPVLFLFSCLNFFLQKLQSTTP